MSRRLSVVLVHHPVLDRQGAIITTTITNLDVHDMSRSARTFGADALYVAHPVPAQRELATRVRDHWTGEGSGARRIPTRSGALELVRVVESLEAAEADVARVAGAAPELWTTAARAHGDVKTYAQARALVEGEGPPVLLVFGTGWGLAESVLSRATVRLAPITGRGTYNHLSVRAACAISLDRLLG